MTYKLCIIIPCFNARKIFLFEEYISFLENNKNVLICFVDDGSTDGTIDDLKRLETKFPKQINLLSHDKNKGKAEAVRTGMLYSYKNYDFEYIAYLDVDLSVSCEECFSLTQYLNNEILFGFGSRIAKVGSVIERYFIRFFIGRIIATFISNILDLKVYDTQCGCKVFKKELTENLFADPFSSKWLFDVELFFRMYSLFGKENSIQKMIEIPLKRWIDKGDSKVSYTYFFKIFFDLYKIKKRYKNI